MNIFGRKGKKDAAAAKAAAAVTKELCQVLGVPLKQAVRNNPSFDGVPVPAVVRECLDYVGLYGLQLEGIYRVSSPKSRLDELEEMANSGRQHEIIFQDAHEAAGLLKRFLRQLPEHILTPQLNNQFNETAKLCKCDPMGPCTCPVALQVKELLLKLPTENFHLLGYVFRHAQLVIQQESRNKMGLAALGVLLQAMLSLDRAVLKMFIMNAGSLADSTGKCTPLFDGVHTKTLLLDCRYAHSPVCASQPDIIYAWAHDAPKLILPEGVAFRVGGSTKAKHLILQVHYMHKMEGEDQSGVRVLHTEEPQPRTAATLLLATDGQMAPKKTEQLEVACVVDEPVELHPFAFRVHTHRHGTNVGGWLVQEDPISGEDHWTLLGQRDPQLPQLFQPLANQSLTITQGDILAARCHIRNDEGRTIKIGPTGEDEMCNFYLMYWTDGDTLEQNACFSPGPPEYKWTTGAGLNHTPKRK